MILTIINSPWILCGAGMLFCFSGTYFFKKNVFEENKSILPAALVVVGGVILIGIGTARYFQLY
jgi:hypothetical protein